MCGKPLWHACCYRSSRGDEWAEQVQPDKQDRQELY